jgi:hypothetical protein
MQEPDDQSTRPYELASILLLKKRKSWEENPSISVHG